MARKRVKYNWLFMIQDLGLDESFNAYCKHCSAISKNRLARAFISHFKKIVPYKCNCYIVGQEMPYLDWLKLRSDITIKWLE